MKRLAAVLLGVIVFGCGARVKVIDYAPNLDNLNDPVGTIKRTLEQQPIAYAYVPVKVEVDEQKMVIHLQEYVNPWTFHFHQGVVPYPYYYKNLGQPTLLDQEPSVWGINILDKAGNSLYQAFTLDEQEAKDFINALSYMIKKSER
jgi:hypothetical protein